MPLKVLYLDDEIDLCEIFQDEFSTDQIVIKTFCDPELALGYAQSYLPDIIFLDYRLQKTNGDKVAQLFDQSIPKYLITGDISVITHYKFISVFKKPGYLKDVHSVLNEALKKVAI